MMTKEELLALPEGTEVWFVAGYVVYSHTITKMLMSTTMVMVAAPLRLIVAIRRCVSHTPR